MFIQLHNEWHSRRLFIIVSRMLSRENPFANCFSLAEHEKQSDMMIKIIKRS